jgi:hypothetical protein
VDLEPGFRAVEVTDGETAVAGFLGAFMPVPDVGPGGVDPDAEQAPGGDMRGGTGQVPVGLAAVAVLEDLDADDKIKLSRRPEGIDAADDQPGRAGPAFTQLADGPRRDVQPDEVQPGVAQGHEVTAVATADVEPAPEIPGPGCADDVAGEAHRRIVAVAAGCVFGVPGRRGCPGAHVSQPARYRPGWPRSPRRCRARAAPAGRPAGLAAAVSRSWQSAAVDGFRSGTITQRIQTADGGIEIVVVQVNVVPVGPVDEMKLVARAAFETVNPHPMNMGPREIARLLRLMADRMDGLED